MVETERNEAQGRYKKMNEFNNAAAVKHHRYDIVKVAQVQAEHRAKAAEDQLHALQMDADKMLAYAWHAMCMFVNAGAQHVQSIQAQHQEVEAALQGQLRVEAVKAEHAQQELQRFQELSTRAASKGRPYEDWVRLCYMELLGHGVSASACSAVIKSVVDSVPCLPDISLDELPTRQAVDNVRLEAGVIAKMHVVKEIQKHKFEGCCLYTDDGTDAQVSDPAYLTLLTLLCAHR